MRYAGRLLCDVRQHVNDVSAMVGYSNAQNFSRAFRLYFGMTPGEYRLMNHAQSMEDGPFR